MTETISDSSVLDALVLVARQHGVDTSAEALRRRFVIPEGPIGDAALVALASEIGLQARALRVCWHDLPRLNGVFPVILRMIDGAALVLDTVVDDPNVGTVAVVRDPTSEVETRAVVDEAQLSRVWDGELILVKRRMDRSDETQPFAMAPPFIAIIVLDRVIVNQSFSTLYVLAGVLLLLIIFEAILGFVRRLFMETDRKST